MITVSDEHRHGSLGPRRRPDACCCCLPWSFLGVLVLRREAWIGEGLESRGLGERIGAPKVLIYGTSKEIVARDRGTYPKKFGKWRDSLNRTVARSFGIQAESCSV
jgi:hypothetical protein